MRIQNSGDAEDDEEHRPIFPYVVEADDSHVVEQDQQADGDNQPAQNDAAATGPEMPALQTVFDPVHLPLHPIVNAIVDVHESSVAAASQGFDERSANGG